MKISLLAASEIVWRRSHAAIVPQPLGQIPSDPPRRGRFLDALQTCGQKLIYTADHNAKPQVCAGRKP